MVFPLKINIVGFISHFQDFNFSYLRMKIEKKKNKKY